MRRSLALVVLALILTPYAALVDAQFIRGMRRNSATIDVAPTIIIDTPTFEPGHSLTAGSLTVEGTVIDDRGVVSVTWACPTCTTTSGTAIVNGNRFLIDAGTPSSTVIGQDSFSVAANTALTAYEGSTIKGATPAWTERVDTCAGGIAASVRNAEQAVSPNATGGNCYALYTMQLSAAITAGNYTIQVRNADTSLPGSDDPQGIVFGRNQADENNRCMVLWYPESNGTDLAVYKRVAGTNTQIGSSVDANFGNNDIGRLDLNGSAIKFYIQYNSTGAFTEVFSATDAFCDDNIGAHSTGIFFGDVLAGTGDPSTSMRIDDFIVTDRGASGAGLAFNVGAHTLTVTATDTGKNIANDTLAITRAASDTQNPAITIATDAQTVTSASFSGFSGTSSDNVLVSTVACTSPTTTPGTLVISGTTTWSAAAFTLATGANVITCTATDSSALTGQAVVTLTYAAPGGEVDDPTVTITTNGGANINNGVATTVSLAGTATDAGSGVAQVTWSNNLGGSGTASSGTGASVSWSIPTINLVVGDNVITVRAIDALGNDATDTITVTVAANTLTVTTASLPTLVEDTTYSPCAVTLQRSGGTAPYSWALQSGTLPPGLSLAAATGCISGTPTTAGTTNGLVFRVTDSASPMAATADSGSLSWTINAAGSAGPHSYYTTHTTGPYAWKQWTFRNQVENASLGGNAPYFNYDPGTDTHLQKQDAAKTIIPPFYNSAPSIVLVNPVDEDDTVFTISSVGSYFQDASYLLGTEIVTYVSRTNGTNGTVTFLRGQFGTTAQSHAAGIGFPRSMNDIPPTGEIVLPLLTDDSYTYLFVWDTLYTDSYLKVNAPTFTTNHKASQFTTSGSGPGDIWLEPNTFFPNNGINTSGNSLCSPQFNELTDVFTVHAGRTYNQTSPPLSTTWTETNGNKVHPTTAAAMGTGTRVAPVLNWHCQKANLWMRWVYRIEQRADDYEYLSVWVIPEGGSAIPLVSGVGISARPSTSRPTESNKIKSWFLEMDTSEERYRCLTAASACVDLVMYIRNFMALRDAGLASAGAFSDANMSTYLVAPIR